MEQLILQLNHTVDKANTEKEQVKIEIGMERVEKIKVDEKSQY